jgi:hypothetical protein
MPRTGNVKNLKPVTTKEEARTRGKNGGKKSAEVRKTKKLMSQIYGDVLAKKYKVKKDGKMIDIDGSAVIEEVVKDILMRRDASSVSMMKEIREATEGQKVEHSGAITIAASPTDENL